MTQEQTVTGSVYTQDMRPKARRGSTQTSVAAAIDVTPKAPKMTDRIWAIFGEGAFSPEEIHARLQRDGVTALLNSVRARVCDLHKGGRLIDSGQRALGESRRSRVIRWRRTTPEEYSAWVARRDAEAADD